MSWYPPPPPPGGYYTQPSHYGYYTTQAPPQASPYGHAPPAPPYGQAPPQGYYPYPGPAPAPGPGPGCDVPAGYPSHGQPPTMEEAGKALVDRCKPEHQFDARDKYLNHLLSCSNTHEELDWVEHELQLHDRAKQIAEDQAIAQVEQASKRQSPQLQVPPSQLPQSQAPLTTGSSAPSQDPAAAPKNDAWNTFANLSKRHNPSPYADSRETKRRKHVHLQPESVLRGNKRITQHAGRALTSEPHQRYFKGVKTSRDSLGTEFVLYADWKRVVQSADEKDLRAVAQALGIYTVCTRCKVLRLPCSHIFKKGSCFDCLKGGYRCCVTFDTELNYQVNTFSQSKKADELQHQECRKIGIKCDEWHARNALLVEELRQHKLLPAEFQQVPEEWCWPSEFSRPEYYNKQRQLVPVPQYQSPDAGALTKATAHKTGYQNQPDIVLVFIFQPEIWNDAHKRTELIVHNFFHSPERLRGLPNVKQDLQARSLRPQDAPPSGSLRQLPPNFKTSREFYDAEPQLWIQLHKAQQARDVTARMNAFRELDPHSMRPIDEAAPKQLPSSAWEDQLQARQSTAPSAGTV